MNGKVFHIRRVLHKSMMVLRTVAMITLFSLFLPQTVLASDFNSYKNAVIQEQAPTVVFYASRNDNELPAIPLPGQQKKLQGDADGNGEVNYMDALLVLRHSVGLEILSDTVVARCDVDGRKGLSYMDALLILRYFVGLITKF